MLFEVVPVQENLTDRHIIRKNNYCHVIHTYNPENVVLKYPAAEYKWHYNVPFVLLIKSIITKQPVQVYYYSQTHFQNRFLNPHRRFLESPKNFEDVNIPIDINNRQIRMIVLFYLTLLNRLNR